MNEDYLYEDPYATPPLPARAIRPAVKTKPRLPARVIQPVVKTKPVSQKVIMTPQAVLPRNNILFTLLIILLLSSMH